MPKTKSSPKKKSSSQSVEKRKQSAEERKVKEDQEEYDDLDKYDIYSLNDEAWKAIQEAERTKDFHPMDDIKAFYDRYR